ncbi:apolipoprotein N-acyltransferase [Asticcacaulis sp. BYS171W]|uniref:Apolipoprotein N-acyltransferase n=1 Tax=Asticcacaulis aquaticus TaxID=2984212 RepID=A0ABT5HSZ8_9CAUL|nr:apolipoprotein N-acyltransferase [Asticcacaulis aquaticus]MDC7683078.1 apolipoprotein N-acyltransferase [Asticcacaulis aquaticus]
MNLTERSAQTLSVSLGLYRRFVGPKRQAALMGLLIGLAQPPFGFLPGLFGYTVLLWSLDQDLGPKPLRKAFAIGWWAGFAYFLVGCFWVAEAFLVDAENQGWMAPFAVTLLPAGIALFWGAAFALYRRFRPDHVLRWLFFVGLFCGFEWLRGTILTGFPWNPAGATWKAGSALSQLAALFGVYGLSLVTVAVFSSLAVTVWGQGSFRMRWRGQLPVLTSAAILCAGLIYGSVRLATTSVVTTDTLVRIVQPNVGQRAKWTEGALMRVLDGYAAMTHAPVKREILQSETNSDNPPYPRIVIWPEGALPDSAENLLDPQSETAKVFGGLLREDQTLLWGAYHQDIDSQKGVVWRNSLLSLHRHAGETQVRVAYSKFKLVPFGEFLPFEKTLEKVGIKELVHVGDGFTAGKRTHSVEIDDIPRFLPLICYEGLFPALSSETFKGTDDTQRPQWIVNISNDAWFGPTTGPVQHLNLSSYRAIEEGLPMVRSTPTGVSAMIDPLGRIIKGSDINIGEAGFRDVLLPAPVKLTPYAFSRYAHLFLVGLFCLIPTAIATFVRVSKRNQ